MPRRSAPPRCTSCFREPGEARNCRPRASCCARTASSTGTTAATRPSTISSASSPRRSARRRKRERRRVAEAGITFRILTGGDIDEPLWADDHAVVRQLVLAARPRALPERGLLPDGGADDARSSSSSILALPRDDRRLPSRSCSAAHDTLYGRYWGSSGDYHSLHFETCYYQGIEYCISHGLQTFEPGTQGEHKIARGFVPTEVWSAHWLSDPAVRGRDRPVPRSRARAHRSVHGRRPGPRAVPAGAAVTGQAAARLAHSRRSAGRLSGSRGSRCSEPNGLLAAGGDLSPERLIAAYRRGIFPVVQRGSADPLVVPGPARGAGARPSSTSRAACAGRCAPERFQVSVDQHFDDVIRLCAATRAESGHLADAGDDRRLPRAARTRLRPLGRGLARTASSPAASTESTSAGCFSASRCSASRPTPRRSRWRSSHAIAPAARHRAHRLPGAERSPDATRQPAPCRAANSSTWLRHVAPQPPEQRLGPRPSTPPAPCWTADSRPVPRRRTRQRSLARQGKFLHNPPALNTG